MDFADPTGNLSKFGLGEGKYVADLGAGSGHYSIAAAKAVGDLQVLTHFGGEYGKDNSGKVVDVQAYHREIGADGKPIPEVIYPQFVEAMNSIGYSGYYSYELCHPLPLKDGEKVGIDYAESCARNACEMMKGLLRNA